jgi:hypothetical protein
MNDVTTDIKNLVDKFATDVAAIAQQAARDALGSAFGESPTKKNGHAISRSIGMRKGAKRDPRDLAAVADKFATFVASHPGLRIEQINREIGLSTAELALPIRKLIADKRVKTVGKKRSTTYFAAGASKTTASKTAKRSSSKKKKSRSSSKKSSRSRKSSKASSVVESAAATEEKSAA